MLTGAGLAVALLAMAAGALLPRGETLWHRVAAPAQDGDWRAITLDGKDVRAKGYAARLRWGKVVQVFDGCNACGGDGDGRIFSCNLQACAFDPRDQAFRALALRRPQVTLAGKRLILDGSGHRAVLVRGG